MVVTGILNRARDGSQEIMLDVLSFFLSISLSWLGSVIFGALSVSTSESEEFIQNSITCTFFLLRRTAETVREMETDRQTGGLCAFDWCHVVSGTTKQGGLQGDNVMTVTLLIVSLAPVPQWFIQSSISVWISNQFLSWPGENIRETTGLGSLPSPRLLSPLLRSSASSPLLHSPLLCNPWLQAKHTIR